ncbi:MAG: HAD family hydrolase [Spirochaetota bacterium]
MTKKNTNIITIRFKGIIFDLDGTLADTLLDITGSMNRVLSRMGFPAHNYNAYKYFVGRGLEHLVIEALPEKERRKETIAECLALLMEDYRVNYLKDTRLYDGIAAMIDEFEQLNFKMAVLSNKADILTRTLVKALLPDRRFETVIGSRPDMPAKPDPTGALQISEIFGIPPLKILYLGDTGIDMMTANKCGMFAIGALWGFRTAEELMENGAKILLRHPGELMTKINEYLSEKSN